MFRSCRAAVRAAWTGYTFCAGGFGRVAGRRSAGELAGCGGACLQDGMKVVFFCLAVLQEGMRCQR